MDWSTLGCARYGHTTYAPDEPELRAQLGATAADGEAWRCLRCATFVPGPPDASGPASAAPVVPRGKEVRSQVILRLFALERFIRAAIFLLAGYLLWRFRSSQSSIERKFDRELPVLRGLFRELGFDIDHSKLVGLLRHALTLSSHTLTLLAAGAVLYAVIEVIEGVGLWQARRWGEYFAFVATSLGLPLEIYDLSRHVTWLPLLLFGLNLLLVVYLAVTKRLFGIRGGKAAYDARLREESVLEAAVEAARRDKDPVAADPAPTRASTARASTARASTARASTARASTAQASTAGADAESEAEGEANAEPQAAAEPQGNAGTDGAAARPPARAGAPFGPAPPDGPGQADSR
jgi:uncharacterized membrane protein (DUF2068 family)